MKKYIYFVVWMNSEKAGTIEHITEKKISCTEDVLQISDSIRELHKLDSQPIILNFILLREEET